MDLRPIPAALAHVLLIVAACEAQPEREPGEDCLADRPPDSSAFETREVELGSFEDGSFTAWQDGQEVEFEIGPQGFSMLTPWVGVAAEAEDGERRCWFVQLDHLDEQGEPVSDAGGYFDGLVFSRVDELMVGGAIFDVLSDDSDGQALGLRVSVTGSDFVATRELEIVVRAP